MQKTKHIAFDFKKATTGEGTFEGMLSVYGNVDGGGDVVEPGAFAKNLAEKGNERPLLWSHNTDMPIGMLHLEDRPSGLWCKGSLLMSLPEAQRTYSLIKAGIVSGLSIGFVTVRDEVKNGVRSLRELKLYEGSVCLFPMNESAQISGVKNQKQTESIHRALTSFREDVLAALKK